MKLFIFDIDGTLCDTYGIDGECYFEALEKVFGFQDLSNDWNDYPETTDSGILNLLFRHRCNRMPTEDENTKMKDCFYDLFVAAFDSEANACQPIAGGLAFWSELKKQDIPVAVATGGWRHTALLKLEKAGYDVNEIPIATADDSEKRAEICRTVIEKSEMWYGQIFEQVIYFGDGLWDARVADELGFRFVGVSTDPTKFENQAEMIVANFENIELSRLL